MLGMESLLDQFNYFDKYEDTPSRIQMCMYVYMTTNIDVIFFVNNILIE